MEPTAPGNPYFLLLSREQFIPDETFKKRFIYLAALGLLSGTWDLQFSTWHAEHSVATRGIPFPDQG